MNVFSSKTLYSTLFKFHINVLNIKEHERQETGDRRQETETEERRQTNRGEQRDKETERQSERETETKIEI